MWWEFWFFLVCLLAVGGFALWRFACIKGVQTQDNWGINLARVKCPRFGAKMPIMRFPTSQRQALWGGGTCRQCGCEVDKWGREIGKSE
jgi:hypothetical protein